MLEITALLSPVAAIAINAGHAILAHYGDDVAVEHKDDRSPLTAADLDAHRLIVEALARMTPQVPVLSEESAAIAWSERRGWSEHWLVDPLDGTREFIDHNGEFTVNIALIRDHVPVLGVVHVPARGITYFGAAGAGAFRVRGVGAPERIGVCAEAPARVRVVGSRSHRGSSLDAFLERLGDHEMVPMGSALKFCIVAEGSADLYPRFGPTCEWDTAAAQAVVEAAGGRTVTLDGEPLRYNTREEILNPWFIVYGDTSRDWWELAAEAGAGA
ncbi:MAG: 3'(2'),5'-bisphosphate nucleotidase CysQ [Gammaproteobacteria bacterium]|nr:3'(2'),5'-bisphosphate nucleotidase CysQ [Gammaproteobacteria bacterium]